MATIKIEDLKVRAIIGTHPWERKNRQEIIINITLTYDATKASRSDKIKDALDYEKITNDVVAAVELSKCQLLEKLSVKLLAIVLADQRAVEATVRINKPQALPLARSVSVEMSGKNP